MQIPSYLEKCVQEGKVVLFLGSGTSLAAKNKNNQSPPSAKKLAELLSDRFLGGKYKDYPLNQVGEYAISESNLIDVQEYLRETFEDFQPTAAHQLMCSFKWECLATTNYDLLIEKAYAAVKGAVQSPVPFIENGDRVEDRMRDSKSIMLLKLHGCITRTNNPQCPLILTTDQYVESIKGRSRIFDHLKKWAFERSIAFVGYSLQDTNMRSIILELASHGEAKQRNFIVSPHFDDIQKRFWETKKITALEGSFEDFIDTLNRNIPSTFRGITVPADSSVPISERFSIAGASLTRNCLQFLENHVEYVKAIVATERIEPSRFYKGDNPGWSATEQGLDCRRDLVDDVLTEHFIDSANNNGLELVLIRAHAGSGKTVVMRRLAWDASRDYNLLCLYLRPAGILNASAIQEIINTCCERVFLFVDNAADRVREIHSLIKEIGDEGRRLTIVIAERVNEWNVLGGSLDQFITAEFDLKYLSPREIDTLIGLLEKHKSLCTLESATPEQRKEAFAKRAGQQLLVALHEATLGRPFEDIIEDEYQSITPHDAQRLYLTICLFNRLDVRVRAGLISRLHGIDFEDFQARLFKPLEHVVSAEYDRNVRDNVYFSRHPRIAEIVFDRVLRTQEDRYAEYIKCLQEMNIDYSSDKKAFNQMIRAKALLEYFPNHELVKQIYATAQEMAGENAHLFHQMGIYEMTRPNGNLTQAQQLLFKAQELFPKSGHIKHSIAEFYIKLAESARTELEANRFFGEATKICQELKRQDYGESYAYHTLVKVGIRRLKALLAVPDRDSLPSEFEETIKSTEGHLFDGLQALPGDSYLLSAESDLAVLLNEEARALSALERAFNNNPRSTILARRLSSCYEKDGQINKAVDTVHKALEANSGDKKLHYIYAKLMMVDPKSSADTIAYHLRKSFSPGDRSFDAQLLYGRQLYISGKIDESRDFFRRLGAAPVAFDFRTQLNYPLDGEFTGTVVRFDTTHCFIKRDGPADTIFSHQRNSDPEVWGRLSYGVKLGFKISFNFKGPCAHEMRIIGDS